MSSVEIRKISITRLGTDAVVNAANSGLWEGGGVCGYIFSEAGSAEMTRACQKIGHCDEGCAVITPGFRLPAKYVIHAVGPRWSGGNHNEPQLLYSAYRSSLALAKENGLHSIGFPLISAGIFGYPVDKAWFEAIRACRDFIDENAGYEINIVFAVLDDAIMKIGEKTVEEMGASTLKAPVAGIHDDDKKPARDEIPSVSDQVRKSAYEWCRRYEDLFRKIDAEDDLRESLKRYSAYKAPTEHLEIFPVLSECMHDAYRAGVVVADYREITEAAGIPQERIFAPTAEWTGTLTADQLLACIAWHFRADYFNNGSWISDSVAGGAMLALVKGYIKKYN